MVAMIVEMLLQDELLLLKPLFVHDAELLVADLIELFPLKYS